MDVNMHVTSTIVKKVRLWHNLLLFKLPYIKYRYFFDVHNTGDAPCSGSVSIRLYNGTQRSPLGAKTFRLDKPIDPGMHRPVYMDIYTPPTHSHRKYGVFSFQYAANNLAVGNGYINRRYEDLSQAV